MKLPGSLLPARALAGAVVMFFSDPHDPRHHEGLRSAALDLVEDVKPDVVIFGGDLVDLPMFSRFEPEPDDTFRAADDIRSAVEFIRDVRRRSPRSIEVVLGGNHEARFRKYLIGGRAREVEGLVGMTMEEQFRGQGLADHVRWVEEVEGVPGVVVGTGSLTVVYRHGDMVGSGGPNPAMRALGRQPTLRQVFGHFHRGNIATRVDFGGMTWAMSNGTMAGPMPYKANDPWTRGFCLVEYGSRIANPVLVFAEKDGSFRYGGKRYAP